MKQVARPATAHMDAADRVPPRDGMQSICAQALTVGRYDTWRAAEAAVFDAVDALRRLGY